jgi:hypothetical protein
MKHLIPLVAVATLAIAPLAASAADTVSATVDVPASTLAVPGAHFTLVDSNGNAVGEVVSERSDRLRLHVIGFTPSQPRPVTPAVDPRADRTFHPDYSHGLSVWQMQAAWQAEMDRINPPPVTGGG